MLRIQLLLLMDLILKVLTFIFVLNFHLENVIVTCSCQMEVKLHLIKLQNFPDLAHAIMQISPLMHNVIFTCFCQMEVKVHLIKLQHFLILHVQISPHVHVQNVIFTCSCPMEVKVNLIKSQNFLILHMQLDLDPICKMSSLPVLAQ